ncbi:hypothetical protein BGZ65_010845, partial [Modicella reniformis]
MASLKRIPIKDLTMKLEYSEMKEGKDHKSGTMEVTFSYKVNGSKETVKLVAGVEVYEEDLADPGIELLSLIDQKQIMPGDRIIVSGIISCQAFSIEGKVICSSRIAIRTYTMAGNEEAPVLRLGGSQHAPTTPTPARILQPLQALQSRAEDPGPSSKRVRNQTIVDIMPHQESSSRRVQLRKTLDIMARQDRSMSSSSQVQKQRTLDPMPRRESGGSTKSLLQGMSSQLDPSTIFDVRERLSELNRNREPTVSGTKRALEDNDQDSGEQS